MCSSTVIAYMYHISCGDHKLKAIRHVSICKCDYRLNNGAICVSTRHNSKPSFSGKGNKIDIAVWETHGPTFGKFEHELFC